MSNAFAVLPTPVVQSYSSAGCSLGLRRRYREGDLFFLEGDLLRCTKLEALDSTDESADVEQAHLMVEEALVKIPGIVCTHNGCHQSFDSISSFNAHYESHYSQCITCSRIFPNERIMDMHILETHSSYFRAQSERMPSYECVVQGCVYRFWSSADRDVHLRATHRFSSTTKLYGLEPNASENSLKTKSKLKVSMKKIPVCRFHTYMDGCRYGSKCKFSHNQSDEFSMEEEKGFIEGKVPDGNVESSIASLLDEFDGLRILGSGKAVDRGKRKTKVQL